MVPRGPSGVVVRRRGPRRELWPGRRAAAPTAPTQHTHTDYNSQEDTRRALKAPQPQRRVASRGLRRGRGEELGGLVYRRPLAQHPVPVAVLAHFHSACYSKIVSFVSHRNGMLPSSLSFLYEISRVFF